MMLVILMRALFLSADGFEDTELFVPYYRLKEEGVAVDVASIRKGGITGKHGYSFEANLAFKDVDPGNYDLLVLPGGKAPEKVRINKNALEIVENFFKENKVVASICHGAQTLISAGLVKGRKITGWRGIQDDLKAAGAEVPDVEVVVDGNLISSREPSDLPAFNRELMKKIGKTLK